MLRRAAARAAALVLLAATACGGGGGESGGDKLVVYSGRGEALVKPLIDRFAKDTGIEVEVRYAGTAELAAQLLEEGGNRKADVFFSQDAGALGALQDADVLVQLPEDVLDRVATRYQSKRGVWVATSGRARVIAYDTRKLTESEVPDSVFDVTAPKWKGQVAIAPPNASFQAFVTAMRVTQGDARTKEWLLALKANGVQTYENNVQILDAIDNGQVTLGLVNHYYLYERIKERGAAAVKVRNHFLGGGDPGALVNVAGVGVVKGTDRQGDAETFARYLLSDPAQRFFVDELGEYPVAGATPPPGDAPPLDRIQGPAIDLADLAPLQETLALLNEVGLT